MWHQLIRAANSATTRYPALRRVGIRAYRGATPLVRWLPGPRILLNGPGKSGTHLLADCVGMLPRTAFSGRHFALGEFVPDPHGPRLVGDDTRHGTPLELPELRRYLRRCPPGMFVTGHAPWHPELPAVFDDAGLRHVCMIRDPADVLVSVTHFSSRDDHPDAPAFLAVDSFEERLRVALYGSEDLTPLPVPPTRSAVASYLPWLRDPSVHTVRYERLCGGEGDEAQLDEIVALATFLDRDLTEEQAHGVADRMISRRSLTYRRGVAGAWRDEIPASLLPEVEAELGPLRRELDYVS